MNELYTPNKIRTATGLFVDPLNMRIEDLSIEDIANALSQIPRFGGHLPLFYSVAEHSIRGARLIQPEQQLGFLLHDATEAYLLDIPKPVKIRLPEYIAAEKVITGLIEQKWNVNLSTDEIKAVDEVMLNVEWNHRMLQQRPTVSVYNPATSKKIFLSMFNEFTK